MLQIRISRRRHKIALEKIPKGKPVIRYGVILGYAMNDIEKGDWINEFMLELPTPPSVDDMEYGTKIVKDLPTPPVTTFEGYRNPNGGYAGTRNILGISTTVQCVTGVLNVAVKRMKEELLPKYPNVDDIVPIIMRMVAELRSMRPKQKCRSVRCEILSNTRILVDR